MKKIKDLNLKIVEKFKIFGPISLAIILIGAIIMAIFGMNIGLDFAGGAKVEMEFDALLANDPSMKTDLVNDINEEGFEYASMRWSGEDGLTLEIGLEYRYNGEKINAKDVEAQQEFLNKIQGDGLIQKLKDRVTAYNVAFDDTVVDANIVSASTAKKLLVNALWATAVAVVVMLIYIAIRFKLTSGLAAVIALLHDILIMIALVTICRVQVNTTFIAAVITIIGYSINATIVIFDRIREVSKLESMKTASDVEIANKSIKDTLGRSVLTTLTTLATIVALAVVCSIMGVTSMQEFALPIIFGLIAGTYSSVFLSASIWVYLRKIAAKIKNKKSQNKLVA